MHTQSLLIHNFPAQVTEEELAGSTVVVIDLLRASSTICAALAAGASEVVPYLEVADTLAAAAATVDRSSVVLGGERGGRRIEGFDFGNSPSEFTPATVGGRRVLLTTTNGTRALWHARRARRVVVGAFMNLSAIAASLKDAPRVDVLCAGTDGHESREDILAAGALIEKLRALNSANWKLDAAAEAALTTWQSRGPDLAIELRFTPGGENLLAIGLDADLVDCARIDALPVVPELDVAAWRITAQRR